MRVDVDITGIAEVQRRLGSLGRQASFAARQTLNDAAFRVNGRIKREMKARFQGGATAYTLRSFNVTKATRENLESSVLLRRDTRGGTSPMRVLRHLFTGGRRDWKIFEGRLRAAGAIPPGFQAVPGSGMKLDARGNMRRSQLREVLGGLRTGLQVVKRIGGNPKGVGYFVLMQRHGKLLPGLYQRIYTGRWVGSRGAAGSRVVPMLVYVPRGTWRQHIDLRAIARQELRDFVAEFRRHLGKAIRTAR